MCAICLGLPLSKSSRHISTVYNYWYSTSASNSNTIKKLLTTFEFDKNEKGYFHPQPASLVVHIWAKCLKWELPQFQYCYFFQAFEKPWGGGGVF